MRRLSVSMLLILGIAVALATMPSQALALDNYVVAQDLDYGRNSATGADELGVFISKRPGGLYMGRLFKGEACTAVGPAYESRKNATYLQARTFAEVCGWV